MTALVDERQGNSEVWKYQLFTLLSGKVAFKNGMAAIRLGTGKVVPGALESDLFVLGKFAESKDASLADKPVNIDLGREVPIEWFANATAGAAVAATDLGALCYILDDQTVSITPQGGSVAGRVWGVDTLKGVAVEKTAGAASSALQSKGVLAAFSSNNINAPVDGGVYDIPTTGAASTVTLSASAKEGAIQYFVADGTKNGHTVTYRDATGTVALTTALTASKRHLVLAMFLNGAWTANAYVSP